MFKQINRSLKFGVILMISIFLTFGFSVSFQALLAAWTAPNSTPPTNNIADLILGGNLGVGKMITSAGTSTLAVDAGMVGVGTMLPSKKLDVNGDLVTSGGDVYANAVKSRTSGADNIWLGDSDDAVNIQGSAIMNKASVTSPPIANADVANKEYVDAAGGGLVINGSTMPTMISNKSTGANYQGVQAQYCASLVEGGFSDWRMPTFDELTYAVSALTDTTGAVVADANYLWTRTNRCDSASCGSNWLILNPSSGTWDSSNYSNSRYVRCVRGRICLIFLLFRYEQRLSSSKDIV